MRVLDAFDLTGKVAVVTGGNTGLGEAFARALSDVGASVAIAARTRDRSEGVAEEISSSGGKAIAVDLDVTDGERPTGCSMRCTTASGPWTFSSTTRASATTGRRWRCSEKSGSTPLT